MLEPMLGGEPGEPGEPGGPDTRDGRDGRTPPERRGDASRPSPARHHGHLWVLLDGTPAHAPPGRLTVGDDGKLAGHLCGRWFDHLGLHLRRHGWDACRYRAAVGLALHRPLCSERLSATIIRRQQENWHRDPRLRQQFAAGQQAARTGDLAALAGLVRRAQIAHGAVPLEVRMRRPDDLARGRQTTAARRAEHLSDVVRAAGHATLADYLRAEYSAGASLETLAHATGLGRARLSAELDAAGIARRPTGTNTHAGRASRARRNEELAAVALGIEADQLGRWLSAQTARGVTLRELAARVGHSVPWVRTRLVS